MKSYSGKSTCPVHGEFDWRFTPLLPGERFFGARDEINLNCNNYHLLDNTYTVEVKCPICAKKSFIDVPKED